MGAFLNKTEELQGKADIKINQTKTQILLPQSADPFIGDLRARMDFHFKANPPTITTEGMKCLGATQRHRPLHAQVCPNGSRQGRT